MELCLKFLKPVQQLYSALDLCLLGQYLTPLLVRYHNDSLKTGEKVYNKIISSNHQNVFFDSLDNLINDTNNNVDIQDRQWNPKGNFIRKNLREIIPKSLLEDLQFGIKKLHSKCPDLFEKNPICLFPMIEGIGYYPKLEDSKVVGENIWVCGDLSGNFRGIIPALVSGAYVGKTINI